MTSEERAFCEGYEYAQREFAEEEREQELAEEEKKKTEKERRKEALKDYLSIGGGIGAAVGLNKIIPSALSKIRITRGSSAGTEEERNRLLGGLEDIAKKKGITVKKSQDFRNSAYFGGNENMSAGDRKAARQSLFDLDDWFNSDKDNDHPVKKILKSRNINPVDLIAGLNGANKKDFLDNVAQDNILMGVGSDNPGVLAHEVGHAHLGYKNRLDGSKLDKLGHLAHTKCEASRLATMLAPALSPFTSIGGFVRGKNAVSTDESGKVKVNKKKLLKTALIDSIPTLLSVPCLAQEATASLHGYRNLKKLGASDDVLKASRRDLLDAFKSYALSSAMPLASGLAGHAAGNAYGILRERIKNRRKRDNNKKE